MVEEQMVERLREELLKKKTRYLRVSDMLVIYEDWCKACGICISLCPQGTLAPDNHAKVYIKYPETCTGCKICELHCPDFAIFVTGKPRKAPRASDLQDQSESDK